MHGVNERGVAGLRSLTPHEIKFPRLSALEHMEIIGSDGTINFLCLNYLYGKYQCHISPKMVD